MKWHYISVLPTILENIIGLFNNQSKYYIYLDVEDIVLMPDLIDQVTLKPKLMSGYFGMYLNDEVVFTKINFRLLGTIISETGGGFTVIKGFFFIISYFFIYREWTKAALLSTNPISRDTFKTYTQEKE